MIRHALSNEEVRRYRAEGYLCPCSALSHGEASAARRTLEAGERDDAGILPAAYRQKPHLLFTAIHRIVRHPAVLDRVESLLGPDLLCWASSLFIKEPGDGAFVSWHQDATYWGLSEPDVATAWIALTPSDRLRGCMRIVPATHRAQTAHRDTHAAGNLLSRGQEVEVEVDESRAVDLVLEPGEMSLHHVLLFHSSGPNCSTQRRIGLAIRYIPTRLRQITGARDSATLVRGVDEHGHFEPESAPETDMSERALAQHARAVELAQGYLYAGAAQGAATSPDSA